MASLVYSYTGTKYTVLTIALIVILAIWIALLKKWPLVLDCYS